MSEVKEPPVNTDSGVGSRSLYESPRVIDSENQRVERARKRESRLEIIRSLKAKKG